MIVKLLTEHHLEFLSLKRGCRGLSESTLVKCQIMEISCRGSNHFAMLISVRMPVQCMAVFLIENMVCVFSWNRPNKAVSFGSHGACFWFE